MKYYAKNEIHISIVGSYKLQHEYFLSHLKDIYSYFEEYIDLEKEHNFSFEKMVFELMPDLISRYNRIEKRIYQNLENELKKNQKTNDTTSKLSHENTSPQLNAKQPKKTKKRPQYSDKKVEKMILEGVFKLKID